MTPRLVLSSLLVSVALLLNAGCSAKCQDADGDGRGEGCAGGPDCDDHDRALGKDCGAVARKCAADDPFGAGCPCLEGMQRRCYGADESTIGVGDCRVGQQTCPTGAWTACEGAITPRFEQCNSKDDDCDGVIDEGALSPCGGCDDQCQGGVWGPPAEPFEAAGELDVTVNGELTLALHPIESHTVWVPNTGEGTLSKIDAQSALEVARYRVEGDTPERVAVDYNGDAWVLSPSLDAQSMLTKVAGGHETCVSPTGGAIVTSRDPSQVLALGEDDCVLLRKSVGDLGDVARSLAIDGLRAPDAPIGGNLWIGMQASQRVLELDGQNANVLMEIPTPGLTPFDAAFDPWGALWVVDRGGRLARIDPVVDPPTVEIHEVPLACYELDSLTSDTHGTLTLTGSSCEDVLVYEPSSNHFSQIKTPSLLDARGVAVLGQESWVTHTAGRISRVGRDPFAIEDTFELAADGFAPLESIAIGADSFGQLWIVSSMGAPGGHGVLTRFDPMQQRVSAEVPLGRLPRGRGDITGDRRLGVLAPEGAAQHVFDGCGGPQLDPSMPRPPQQTDWLRVHVAWNPGVGSSVMVEGRRAKDRDALADAPFTVLGSLPQDKSPFDVPFETGGVVELRLTLRAAGRIGAPRIARVGLEWRCPGPS